MLMHFFLLTSPFTLVLFSPQVLMALYVMCTPMVFVFLADARKKAYQDRVRASTPPAPENGIVFPKVFVYLQPATRHRHVVELGPDRFHASSFVCAL